MLTAEKPQEQPRNPFSHPFVRFVRDGDGSTGHYEESAVYNAQTGHRKLCWPIDAKEMVATGGWSYTRPTDDQMAAARAAAPSAGEPDLSLPSDPTLDPEPDEVTAEPVRRGPGRPRKNPLPS